MFNIRRCIKSDLPDILKIERRSFRHPYSYSTFSYYLHSEFSRFIIIEEGSRLLGYAVYTIGNRRATIVSIAVSPDSRRRGIGSALLDYIMNDLVDKVDRIELQVGVRNFSAQNFYQRYGFKISRKILNYYPDGEDALLMTKTLKDMK